MMWGTGGLVTLAAALEGGAAAAVWHNPTASIADAIQLKLFLGLMILNSSYVSATKPGEVAHRPFVTQLQQMAI